MTDYSELKRLASAAKNWGGEIGEHRWYEPECFKQPYFSVPDAEFLAGCEPGAVVALIAEVEALRKDSERLKGSTAFVKRLCDSAGKQPSVATGYLHDILVAMSKESSHD